MSAAACQHPAIDATGLAALQRQLGYDPDTIAAAAASLLCRNRACRTIV